LRLNPKIIAIVDGFFENTASVRHKEILYAISKGVKVYGAASMGALRASELNYFGMEGIGKIYHAYLSNKITDDDEVCVLHRPEKSNYEPISDAMVNIRETIRAALTQSIINESSALHLLSISKLLHYKERSLKSAIIIAEKAGVSDLEKFTFWLNRHGMINQKYLDSKQLLIFLNGVDQFKKNTTHNFQHNHSLYLRTLQLDVMCSPSADHNLSEKECVIARHLAYFLAAKDAILSKRPELSISDDFSEHYFRCVVIFLDLSVDKIINPTIKNVVSLICQLWNFLDAYIQASSISIQDEFLQKFVNNFRRERRLETAELTFSWMKKYNLDNEAFHKTMVSFFQFYYFVLKNNFDQLGVLINTEKWWFLEAVRLSQW